MAQQELVDTFRALDKLDDKELLQANKYLRDRLSQIRARASMVAKYQFQEGDKVEYTAKYGVIETGTISKINRTTAVVGRWRVPLHMLRKAAEVEKVA
jgi:DNA-directed RNA polymerase subunit H (RpoH/RPB5)